MEIQIRVWTLRTVVDSASPSLFQAPINFSNSEFYGFSEFFYCMEDVLRIGGQYDSERYSQAAKVHLHAHLSFASPVSSSHSCVWSNRITAPPSGPRCSSAWTTSSSPSKRTSADSG